jgi:hypothetical protein
MPESWANHIKLLDLMENALIAVDLKLLNNYSGVVSQVSEHFV